MDPEAKPLRKSCKSGNYIVSVHQDGSQRERDLAATVGKAEGKDILGTMRGEEYVRGFLDQ